MSDTQFDTDIGGQRLDFEDFDTDLFSNDGVGIDIEAMQATLNIQPKTNFDKPLVQQNFNTSSGAAAVVTATITSGLNAWKPTAVNTEKVDKGVHQKQGTANTQVVEAKSAIAQMREQAKDMTKEATAEQGGPEQDASLGRKLTSGAITDMGLVGAAALIDPTGVLPSMAATATLAKDLATIGAHTMSAITGQGTEATRGKGNDLAKSSREISGRKGEVGYVSSESAPVDDAPVTNAVFAKLSQGPGFGKSPVTMDQVDYADSTLPYIALNVEETPEMQVALNTLEAGKETVQATAKVTQEGYVATVDNLLDAQDMAPNAVGDNPFVMKNPFETDLDAGPGRVMV